MLLQSTLCSSDHQAPARKAFFKKNIYINFEPQLNRIMSKIPQFQCYLFFYYFRDYHDYGKKIMKLEMKSK